ncbi:hypothetical protein ACEWY4_014405 [Coilia grayii]|uniref:Amino acid transporter transmembrane domain-containing protein n=1 Tax=Coilia grayii TaxID=363190 RepID=A0ABD1JS81_9TELE
MMATAAEEINQRCPTSDNNVTPVSFKTARKNQDRPWKLRFIYLQCYFLSIATILGTGILGLPVTIAQAGLLPFLVSFIIGFFMQALLIYLFVDLLQRCRVSQMESLKSAETERILMEDVSLQDSPAAGPEDVEEEGEGEEADTGLLPRDSTPQELRQSLEPNLHVLGVHFLSKNMSRAFNFILLFQFISIGISYVLAGSEAYAALFHISHIYVIPAFTWILSMGILLAQVVIQPITSLLTLLKGILLIITTLTGVAMTPYTAHVVAPVLSFTRVFEMRREYIPTAEAAVLCCPCGEGRKTPTVVRRCKNGSSYSLHWACCGSENKCGWHWRTKPAIIIIIIIIRDQPSPPLSYLLSAEIYVPKVAVTFVVGSEVQQETTNDFSQIGKPFLMGTVALGGIVNVMPFLFSEISHNKSQILWFRRMILGGLATCTVLNILWCWAVLEIVPQMSVRSVEEGGDFNSSSVSPQTHAFPPTHTLVYSNISLQESEMAGEIATIPLTKSASVPLSFGYSTARRSVPAQSQLSPSTAAAAAAEEKRKR